MEVGRSEGAVVSAALLSAWLDCTPARWGGPVEAAAEGMADVVDEARSNHAAPRVEVPPVVPLALDDGFVPFELPEEPG